MLNNNVAKFNLNWNLNPTMDLDETIGNFIKKNVKGYKKVKIDAPLNSLNLLSFSLTVVTIFATFVPKKSNKILNP